METDSYGDAFIGRHVRAWNVLALCPPLTITREELDEGLAVLDDALAIADEYVV